MLLGKIGHVIVRAGLTGWKDGDIKEYWSGGKKFYFGDVVSITSGRLCSPDHIGGVYNILNYMTDDDLFTHQLPRASKRCKPYLLTQYPELGIFSSKFISKKAWRKLAKLIAKNKSKLLVSKLPSKKYKHVNPFQELDNLGVKDKALVVAGV